MKKKFALALTLVLITVFSFNTFAFAAGPPKLTATMPGFSVTVNGQVIDNANSRYPLLVYKGITYFPMTWDYTRALGLKTGWDSVEGFSIEKDPSLAGTELKQDLGYVNDLNAENTVSMAGFKVRVNGKEIDNNSEEYPLLVFRDVTYFPMTWRFAVTEFGLKTSWDSLVGFGIEMDTDTLANNKTLMEPVEIAATAGPGVVYIEVYDKEDYPISIGSGFIVTADGLVVTNAHVIAGGYRAMVRLSDGRKFDVEGVTAFDFDRDIAVLKINGSDLPTVALGNSDDIALGQRVVAIGSPLGFENTISEGLISSKSRTLGGYSYIQTTTPISPGSSGGALLNYYGEVVGMLTLGFQEGQNLNMAIPVNAIKDYLKNDTILKVDSKNGNQLYKMSYREYEKWLNITASNMSSYNYSLYFYNNLILELGGSDEEAKIQLVYYIVPNSIVELTSALDDGQADAIMGLFVDIAENLMEYYEKDVTATIVYFNVQEEYTEGFENNAISSDTIEYESESERWIIMYPLLEVVVNQNEDKFYYKWWFDN